MNSVNTAICRKEQGVAEEGNSCLTTPGTCESCPNWSTASLMPNGIENVVLHCLICTRELPRSRRKYGTCLPTERACQKVLTMFRRYTLQTTKCKACLHPATPQEREAFKQWRRETGQLRKKGRPERKKILDNENVESGTPDIALCDSKQPEKPLAIASKNDARKRSRFDDLDVPGHLPTRKQKAPK